MNARGAVFSNMCDDAVGVAGLADVARLHERPFQASARAVEAVGQFGLALQVAAAARTGIEHDAAAKPGNTIRNHHDRGVCRVRRRQSYSRQTMFDDPQPQQPRAPGGGAAHAPNPSSNAAHDVA